MSRPLPLALGIALVVGILVFVAVIAKSWPSKTGPEIIGKVDTVPDTVIVQSRPKIVTKWRDRIVIKTVPVRVAVSEGTPDTMYALRYARRVLAADSARRARIAAKPPILPPASGSYDGKRLTLWLTRSDGSLLRSTAELKPRFAFWSGYDKGSDTLPLYQSDRWFVQFAREVKGCSIPTVILAVGGGLLYKENFWRGALYGGSAGLIGCIAG